MATGELLHDKLNRETAKLQWQELEKAYSQGRVLWVNRSCDLIEVAVALGEDRVSAVKAWMDKGELEKLDDIRARDYAAREAVFWAVVIAPWVLVQEADSA